MRINTNHMGSLCHMICRTCIGSELEREGHDRSDINLPSNQLQLLKDVSSAANCMLKIIICALHVL